MSASMTMRIVEETSLITIERLETKCVVLSRAGRILKELDSR